MIIFTSHSHSGLQAWNVYTRAPCLFNMTLDYFSTCSCQRQNARLGLPHLMQRRTSKQN